MDSKCVNHWSLVENEKAKEFHAANHDKFMSGYHSTLADAAATKSDDKRAAFKAKAEAMRIAYNAKLRKYCES